MSFKEYLAKRRPSYDARGDFVRLAIADTSMPEFNSWIELRQYLDARRTPQGLIEAAEILWGAFQGKAQRSAGLGG